MDVCDNWFGSSTSSVSQNKHLKVCVRSCCALPQNRLQPGLQSLHELAWEHLTLLSNDTLARIAKQLLCALGRHQPLLSHWRRAAILLENQVPPLRTCIKVHCQVTDCF